MRRNQWLASVGITGWNQSECPAGMRRNTQAARRRRWSAAEKAAIVAESLRLA
jgi:hypothetical protein